MSTSSTLPLAVYNVVDMGDAIPKPLLSDYARLIFQWVISAVVISIISTFGVVTNVINIICFVKQGLKEAVHISLLGLAVSDLGCLLTSFVISICFYPPIDPPFDPLEFLYLTVGWPHVVFSGLTSSITALVTLERCLSVTMPLKVKRIMTPKRVVVIIFIFFLLLTAGVAPVYYTNRLVWTFSPERNKTIITMVYTNDRAIIEQFSVGFSNVLFPFSAFFTIIICTTILVIQLQNKSEWRKTCSAPVNGQEHTLSVRDRKVTKMVVMVSAVFIVCFSPICLACIAMVAVPGLAIDGQDNNLIYVMSGITFLLESTNSSANILIYFHMSSRYRSVLKRTFLPKTLKIKTPRQVGNAA